MEERIIELSVDNRSEVIKLPINPKTVEITSKQLNQTITLLEMGEVNLPGDCGLKRTKFPASSHQKILLSAAEQKIHRKVISPCWMSGKHQKRWFVLL